MEIQTLKSGAAIVAHKGQVWLLDAPKGVGQELAEQGIAPDMVLTTCVAAPGLAELQEGLKVVRQIPVRGDGLEAEAVQRGHGWDYVVRDESGASLLYTQRGDVSVKDVEPHALAVIGNKYRANAFGESVITRPWPVGSWFIRTKPYSSMADVNPAIKGIKPSVTLGQANMIASWADEMEQTDDGPDNPWAAAIALFKKSHHVAGGKWVKNEGSEAEKARGEGQGVGGERQGDGGVDSCVCPSCGHKQAHSRGTPCSEATCSECGRKGLLPAKPSGGPVGHVGSRATVSGLAAGVKAERGGKYYKTEDGKEFPASDYLVVEDSKKPDSWHLRITKEPGGPPDRDMMGGAAAALTAPGGHRGNRYQGPNRDQAISKLRGLYRNLDVDKEDWPAGLRGKSLTEVMAVLKAIIPDLPDMEEEGKLEIFKSDEGQWRWSTITSAVMWDRQDELVTRKAMDFALAYAQVTGERGPLRHEHVPGLDVGRCDWQMRVGDHLFESGYFYDTPFAQQCRKVYQEHPGYKVSAGLRYQAGDLVDGIYHRMIIFERSATKNPAVPFTALGVKHMFEVSDEMLKQYAEELDWPLEEVKELVERALKSEKPPESLEALKTAVDEAKTVKAVDAVLDSLTDEAKELLRAKLAPQGSGDKDELAGLKAVVEEQTKALAALAEALKSQKAKQERDDILDILSQLPRKEAAQFAVDKTGASQVNLESIKAQLDEMQAKMEKATSPTNVFDSPFYDAYTSRTLNQEGA